MDKAGFGSQLQEGLSALGLSLAPEVQEGLWRFQAELLKWNSKVNLTAITEPLEVLEKHFIDSLAALPEVRGAASILDVGAGAGLPGIPLALAEPKAAVTLVDAVEKKVTFMKVALATLGLAPRCRAIHARAVGHPEQEGLVRAEVLIARAFQDFAEWLSTARPYVAPGGRVVAMLGKAPGNAEQVAASAGGRLVSLRQYQLPFTRAERAVAVVVFDSVS